MKNLTEQEAFEECIKMWKYVLAELDKGNGRSVENIKADYCTLHDLEISSDCYLCEHSDQAANEDTSCTECCILYKYGWFGCTHSKHCFSTRPSEFYKYLLQCYDKYKELNK